MPWLTATRKGLVGTQSLEPRRRRRIARQDFAIGAHQIVEVPRRLFDHGVEIDEIARTHRDRDDASERAIGSRQTAHHREAIGAAAGPRRPVHVADIGSGIRLRLRLEVVAIGIIGVQLRLRQPA